MIKMIRGTYGRKVKGATVAITPKSAPFTLSAKEEKRLVDAGAAVYADTTPQGKTGKSEPPQETEPSGTEVQHGF